MNSTPLVRVGRDAVNIERVLGAHWDGPTLYVYLDGGRFLSFSGLAAQAIWSAIESVSIDLQTGEVKK